MFYVLQNESTAALRRVPILLTDAATGSSAQTGIALTTIFPYVNINGGAFIGGTGSVAEADFGQYYYEMALGETNTLGLAGIHITAAGCRNYDAIAQISAFNMYSAAGLGLTAGDVWSYDISGVTAAGSAGTQLNIAAAGGATLTAAEVWDYNGATVPGTVKETLDLTASSASGAESNTNDIGNIVWNRNPISSGDNTTGDFYAAYLYQLGIGATGFTPVGGAGLTVGDVSDAVWNAQVSSYPTSGSYGFNILRSDNAGLAGSVTVWSGASYTGVYADAYRIDQSYDAATYLKNILTGVGSTITGNIIGDLSGSVGSVTADVNVSTASMSGIAGTVWTTDISVYTSPQAGAIVTDIQTDTNTIITDISNVPNNVWSSDISGYSTPGEAGYELSQAALGGGGITAGDVWTYATRTITGGLADTVTTLTDRSGFAITGGTITTVSDKTGYSLSGTQSFNLTGNITGNLSGSVGSVTNPVTVTNGTYASIASSVWNSPVASFAANGTFGLNVLRADQANKVGDVTLYSSGGVNGVDADVHRIANDTAAATAWKNILTGIGASITSNITGSVSGSVGSVTGSVGSVVAAVSLSTATQASIANSVWLTDVTSYVAPSAGEDLATAAVGGISPADVWTYASRTITGGLADTVTTLTNRSGFAITGGTITTVSDKTGYSLSGSQTFNLTGNITGSVSGSVGSVSGAVGSVTGAVGSVTGNVGGNVVGSVASVTAPVSITTAAMGSIGSTVWNYILSDSQSADTNLVAAGGGGISITAGDVWSYNTRTLTSGAGITVIGAVQLVNGPYRLTSNQNNSDGILDILQNSVQEINLNLIDGNGSPASTAGYGAIINIFDVAGAAVTSYTPTVEYADGGILTFELDTDVTSTIGRYNLIVGLSGAGFNVKYGPLQILVRPL